MLPQIFGQIPPIHSFLCKISQNRTASNDILKASTQISSFHLWTYLSYLVKHILVQCAMQIPQVAKQGLESRAKPAQRAKSCIAFLSSMLGFTAKYPLFLPEHLLIEAYR